MCCLIGNWHFVFTDYSVSTVAERSSSVVKKSVLDLSTEREKCNWVACVTFFMVFASLGCGLTSLVLFRSYSCPFCVPWAVFLVKG